MELLLNLVWLLVVAVAIVSWLYHNRDRSTARPRVLLQMITLACILAVLFPAISATDDLHASQLAVEASDVARKVLMSMNTVTSSGTVGWLHFLPALLLLAMAVTPRRKFFTKVSQSRCMLPVAAQLSLLKSRAPPSRASA